MFCVKAIHLPSGVGRMLHSPPGSLSMIPVLHVFLQSLRNDVKLLSVMQTCRPAQWRCRPDRYNLTRGSMRKKSIPFHTSCVRPIASGVIVVGGVGGGGGGGWLVGRLVGWLVSQSVGRFVGRSGGRSVGWLVGGWLVGYYLAA